MPSRTLNRSRTIGTLQATVSSGTTSYQDDLGLINLKVGGDIVGITNLDQYGIIDLGDEGSVPGKFTGAAGKCVKYGWHNSPRGAVNLGPTATVARAGGWLIHSSATSNQSAEVNDHGGFPLANMQHAGYQAACLQAVRDYRTANSGYDGIRVDDFLPDITWYTASTFPFYDQTGALLWSNNTDYQNALISFAQNVYGPLKTDGLMVILNAKAAFATTPGSDHGLLSGDRDVPYVRTGQTTKEWAALWAAYVTGIAIEFWIQDGGTHAVGLNNHATSIDYWDEWQDVIDYVQGLSIGHYSFNLANPSTEQAKARYLRASFLMRWNGGAGAVIMSPGDYISDPWSAALAFDPGRPIGAKTAVGSGWKRQYEHYLIYINPTAITQTLDGHSIASGDALFV